MADELDFILRIRDEADAVLKNAKGNFQETATAAESAGTAIGHAEAATSKMASSTQGMNPHLATARDGMKDVALGAAGVVTGFAAFSIASEAASKLGEAIGGAVSGAIADEAAQAKLGQTLKNNVPGFDGNTEAIQKQAEAGVKLGFTNEEMISSFAKLVTVTHDVGKATDVQNVAMDLARMKGIDLATASEALTKVEGGRYKGLIDLGIVLPAHTSQTAALAAVEKVAAGQAEAFGNTTAGAMQEASVALGDAGNKAATVFLPAITSVAHFVTNSLLPAVQTVATGVETMLAPLGNLNDFLNAVSTANSKLQDSTDTATSRAEAFRETYLGVTEEMKKQIAAEEDNTRSALALSEAVDRANGSFNDHIQVDNEAHAAVEALGGSMDTLVTTQGKMGTGATSAAQDIATLTGELKSAYGMTISQAEAALALARGMDAAAVAAQNAAAGIAAFRAGHPTNAGLKGTADANIAFSGVGIGSDGDPNAIGVANLASADAAFQMSQSTIAANTKAAKAHGGGGSHAASAAAAAAAKQAAQEIQNALQAEQAAGDAYLQQDHVHNQQLIDGAHQVADAKIEDAHRTASAQIAAARTVVANDLANARVQNAAPVTAAEKELSGEQTADQLAGLNANLKAAQQSGNQDAINAANRQLLEFQQGQNIVQLKAQQAANDQQAQDAATAATKELNDRQTAEDAQYNKQKADEATAYAQKKSDEDDRFNLLKGVFDDHMKALLASKDASIKLAESNMVLFYQRALEMAKADLAAGVTGASASDVKLAQHDLNDALAAQAAAVPKHAGGLSYVPYDGYLASLHKGEEVRTAADAQRGGGVTFGDVHLYGVQNVDDLWLQLKRLARSQGVNMTTGVF